MVADFSVEGTNHLNALGAAFKAAGDEGKGLKRELLKEIRDETKPASEDVRRSAESLLPRRGGLAARVAGSRFSTSTRFGANTAGVRIVGKSGYNISRMNAGTLRHPVFGNRSAWVTQSVRPHWFDQPIERAADHGLRDAVVRAISSMSERIHP